MNIDPDNPNLDGDYVALLEVKKKRDLEKTQRQPTHTPNVRDAVSLSPDVGHTAGDDIIIELRLELSGYVTADDVDALRMRCFNVTEMGKSLSDLELRDPANKATILHLALENHSLKVTAYLINNTSVDFLMQSYDVSVKGTSSKKTALHILSDIGDLGLIKNLLDRIPPGNTKEAFIRQTVLMEIPGQRPRDMSSVHIAAFSGHTNVVEYFTTIGVDVNFVNSKQDTPILWAARWNHIETVRSLIRLGANLQYQNDKGSTPLYWAVRYGLKDMVEVLIKEGKADVNLMRKVGLVYPVVLASVLGYSEIAEILLQNGANVNVRINGGFTPLHHAAQQGNINTVATLLKYGASVDAETDFGESALLVAAEAGEQAVIELLSEHGSDIDDRNMDGQSSWDYAIESPTNDFLISFIRCYQTVKKQEPTKLVLTVGKTPLHIAAEKNDPEKIQCLLDHGVDIACRDHSGNTFFHTAARACSMDVLKTFIERVNINIQNDEGNTALHLACTHGNLKVVNLLLKKVKLGVKNLDHETVLHTACRSKSVTPDIVSGIVETVVKAHNWNLVDGTEHSGNTALHLAVKFERHSILSKLKPLSPHVKNAAGDSPQHIAVSTGSVTILKEFLNIFRKEMNVDLQNTDGNTMLHMATVQGNSDMVEILIKTGCDLTAKNNEGNTAIHMLVCESVRDNEDTSIYLSVFDTIVTNATRWWCMRQDLALPEENTDLFHKYKRRAMHTLTSDILNGDQLSVLTLAAKSGAKSLLERCLHSPGVYMYTGPRGGWLFDVTKLTSVTVGAPVRKNSSKTAVMPLNDKLSKTDSVDLGISRSADRVVTSSREGSPVSLKQRREQSCLDLIVRSSNLQIANEMLDVVPIKQIVRDYWAAYQWIYAILLIVHVTNMALLSVFAVPLVAESIANKPARTMPHVFFLLWPCFLIVYEGYSVSLAIYRRCRGIDESEPALDDLRNEPMGFSYVVKAIIALGIYYLSHVIQLLYSVLVITWFVLYIHQQTESQAHVLAAALIFGWLFTMAFTVGFETVHSYSVMLKNIVVRDISRFLFLYLFVLLAFSFAVQVILYLAPADVLSEYPSIWHIMFTVFNLMIGMGDLFSESIVNGADKYGKAGFYLRLVYIFYIIFTTIILLNLLIAMMTDSYADVKSREGTTWRVQSVRMALNMEKALPRIFSLLGLRKSLIRFDLETSRWLMSLPKGTFTKDTDSGDRTTRALSRLQHDVHRLHDLYVNLGTRVEDLIQRLETTSPKTAL